MVILLISKHINRDNDNNHHNDDDYCDYDIKEDFDFDFQTHRWGEGGYIRLARDAEAQVDFS